MDLRTQSNTSSRSCVGKKRFMHFEKLNKDLIFFYLNMHTIAAFACVHIIYVLQQRWDKFSFSLSKPRCVRTHKRNLVWFIVVLVTVAKFVYYNHSNGKYHSIRVNEQIDWPWRTFNGNKVRLMTTQTGESTHNVFIWHQILSVGIYVLKLSDNLSQLG